ncbi:MAG: chemotaxis response regulator protein-glutamate methylesterase [Planctomycetota bacterium]
MTRPINVVIADDSAFMRKKIREILSVDPDIRVVAAARDGQEAVALVKEHEPDVVTMDINMPVMDGITALQIIMAESPRPVLMLSSLTQEGALATLECLELGAWDYIGKPSGTISIDLDRQAAEIIAMVKAASRCRVKRELKRKAVSAPVKRFSAAPRTTAAWDRTARRVVAIGVSTGGPKTLLEILPYLPADLDAAVVVVQHMPETFTGQFATRLNGACRIPFKEAEAGDNLESGHGYLARGGKHLTFGKRVAGGATARYSTHPSDSLHIPSVDVMMDSAIQAFGPDVIGVLLTGMGDDGADAMVHVRRAGGQTIAEAESTSIVFGMPAQAIQRGGADFVLPCHEIADKIVSLVACLV